MNKEKFVEPEIEVVDFSVKENIMLDGEGDYAEDSIEWPGDWD